MLLSSLWLKNKKFIKRRWSMFYLLFHIHNMKPMVWIIWVLFDLILWCTDVSIVSLYHHYSPKKIINKYYEHDQNLLNVGAFILLKLNSRRLQIGVFNRSFICVCAFNLTAWDWKCSLMALTRYVQIIPIAHIPDL